MATRLGAGGVAEVWLARRPDGRLVAEKRLLPHLGADARRALVAEGEAAMRVDHPRLVRAFRVIDEPGTIELELVVGVSLAELLDGARRRGGLAVGVARRLLGDVLEGLEALEKAGLTHGDLTPANVLVSDDGTAKLSDFGGPATAAFARMTSYAAPEVVRGSAPNATSDVFSAGVVAWETLRTARLFAAPSEPARMLRVTEEEAPPVDRDRPDLTPLRAVVAAALAKDPAARPRDATELRARLDAVAIVPASHAEVAAAIALHAGELAARRRAAIEAFRVAASPRVR